MWADTRGNQGELFTGRCQRPMNLARQSFYSGCPVNSGEEEQAMKHNRQIAVLAGSLMALTLIPGCTADGPAGLFNLFAGGVNIVIENATGYRATPRISVSDAENFIEEITGGSDALTDIGQDGIVHPNQTERTSVSCGGDVQLIIFEGASFESNGLPVGGVTSVKRLERDKDFACGDTIRVRLTGEVLSFQADVEVVRAPGLNPFGGENDDDDESIADVLDDLFGGL